MSEEGELGVEDQVLDLGQNPSFDEISKSDLDGVGEPCSCTIARTTVSSNEIDEIESNVKEASINHEVEGIDRRAERNGGDVKFGSKSGITICGCLILLIVIIIVTTVVLPRIWH